MPLLERLAVNPNENRDEHAAILCADIVSQPARRSVHADAAIAMDNGINVSDVILSQISDTESELFAMGAYRHSHTRELTVGSVDSHLRPMGNRVF